MTTVTTSKPYMAGPGKHESNCDSGGRTDSAKAISYNVPIYMPGQTNSQDISTTFAYLRANPTGPEISGTHSTTGWLTTCNWTHVRIPIRSEKQY
jgi:hypothetical protein